MRAAAAAGLLLSVSSLGWLGGMRAARCDEPAAPSGAGTPSVVVENSEVDLGRLVRGEVAKGRFALRNTGNAELRILSAKPG